MEKCLSEAIEIRTEKWGHPIDYLTSVSEMKSRLDLMSRGDGVPDFLWLLEHNEVYTVGSMGSENDIISSNDVPVVNSSRGGKVTYHGPGQRVMYSMINLKKKYSEVANIRRYVFNLEEVIILTLKNIGLDAVRRSDAIGIWIDGKESQKKIASIGVRVKNWITFHGIALNVDCDLGRFKNIIPCGVKDAKVTSLLEEGALKNASKDDVDSLLTQNFIKIFQASPLGNKT